MSTNLRGTEQPMAVSRPMKLEPQKPSKKKEIAPSTEKKRKFKEFLEQVSANFQTGDIDSVFQDILKFKTDMKMETVYNPENPIFAPSSIQSTVAKNLDKLVIADNPSDYFKILTALGKSKLIRPLDEGESFTSYEDLVKLKPSESVQKKVIDKVVEDRLNEIIDDIEKKEDKTLNEEQKSVIKEQVQEDVEDRVKKSTEEAIQEQRREAEAKQMETEDKPMEQEAKPMEPSSPKVQMSVSKPDPTPDPKPKGQAVAEPLQPLPTLSQFIPPMRLSSKGKTIKQLMNDIKFFMESFPTQLKKEKEFLERIDKKKISEVRELHARIVAKLRPFTEEKQKPKQQVGVVINADDYIRNKMKEILQDSTFNQLRPANVVIDVGSKEAESRTRDYGDFEIKPTVDGGLASKREAIYRYIPSENDPNVGEYDEPMRNKGKPNRLELGKPKLYNQRTTAMRMTRNNPFKTPQKKNRLRYLD